MNNKKDISFFWVIGIMVFVVALTGIFLNIGSSDKLNYVGQASKTLEDELDPAKLLSYEIHHADFEEDGLEYHLEVKQGSSDKKSDPDNDGLNDLVEFNLGSNPTRPDTDNDGLLDWYEFEYGISILSADQDMDGLNDEMELRYGTYINDADSDGDGYGDGYEVSFRTNPKNVEEFPLIEVVREPLFPSGNMGCPITPEIADVGGFYSEGAYGYGGCFSGNYYLSEDCVIPICSCSSGGDTSNFMGNCP